MLYIFLAAGLLASVLHAAQLRRDVGTSPYLTFGFVLIAGLVVYGYALPLLLVVLGADVLQIDGLNRHFERDAFVGALRNYVIISIGFLCAHQVVTRFVRSSPEVHRAAPVISKRLLQFLFIALGLMAAVAFYFRYGGFSGFVAFTNYASRRDAYAAEMLEGGLAGRFDLLGILLAAVALFLARRLRSRHGKFAVILAGISPLLITMYTGSRLPIVILITLFIFIAYRNDSSKLLMRGARWGLLLVLALPLFTMWGHVRNTGDWLAAWQGVNTGVVALLPPEFGSGYIASMTWNVDDGWRVREFLSQFFPGTFTDLLGVEKFSMSSEFNWYLRGGAPAVYVVSIGSWATFPLPGQVGTFTTAFLLYCAFSVFFAFLGRFCTKLPALEPLFAALLASTWYVVRLDPGAWSSRFLQMTLIFCLAILAARLFAAFDQGIRKGGLSVR